MKHKHPLLTKLASLAAITLLATGAASAQTYNMFYADSGSGANAFAGVGASDGTLSSIGYDSYTFDQKTNANLSDTGAISARPFQNVVTQAYTMDFTASSLATTGPAGSQLDSVTIYLYVEGLLLNNQTNTFTLYDGLNRTGSVISSISLTDPANELNYFSFSVTAAQWAGGVSVGSTIVGQNFTVSSENTSTAAHGPGLLATYITPVPEPAAALLGAFGSVMLLRRRRA